MSSYLYFYRCNIEPPKLWAVLIQSIKSKGYGFIFKTYLQSLKDKNK